ncbi:SPOC like C-terminal domain-containing protein [Cyathus striatus]|nr:SPOC like C-terminal domain-containing protein [Cyathus striatus]
MPAERAGYTVTMFLVDTSPSMANLRTVQLPPGPAAEDRTIEITHLEWALQFVKLKIQEMIFNGRKTDQCGVILFGSQETNNIVSEKSGGYYNVSEYIPIAQPSSHTLAKLDLLHPSDVTGDPIDALIVAVETQAQYLASKKTWTRKIVIITDAENPIEVEDWEATVRKMDAFDISLTIVGVDFDDQELPFEEPNKSSIKAVNEKFYHILTGAMKFGIVGNLEFALLETNRPDVKQTSKCTALARPKSWKKFGLREKKKKEDEMDVDKEEKEKYQLYAMLKMRTEYYVDREEEDGDLKMDEGEDDGTLLLGADEEEELDEDAVKKKIADKERAKREKMLQVEKEDLVRGFKYGTTYVPCPDGQFPRLSTRKGIDICGFFSAKHAKLMMDEVQYVWADPNSPEQEVALSSIVQAMYEKNVMAIARWVSKDGMDPKMGVLLPMPFDEVDCLLWARMPFADDVRKYSFASLSSLVSKKGEVITEHPYLPTEKQQEAMDNFVDAMDLMEAGDKDDEGNRMPWFDTRLSFNPAIHRVKQAMFHAAVVQDIQSNPLPPPHPELLKYFNPPKRVLKRAHDTVEECKTVFKVKQVPKKVARARKDAHQHAAAEDETVLLLDRKQSGRGEISQSQAQITQASPIASEKAKGKAKAVNDPNDSDTEDDDDDEMILDKKPALSSPVEHGRKGPPLPTPARSVSPGIDPGRAPGRIIGSTYPLKDFQKNIAQGDVVSKAVEDLGEVIKEVIMRPFASRRSEEILECMKVLRDTCLKEDEIDAWNGFIEDLKGKCLAKPGNPAFWSQVKKEGRVLGLITQEEAEEIGGVSTVSGRKANLFMS